MSNGVRFAESSHVTVPLATTGASPQPSRGDIGRDCLSTLAWFGEGDDVIAWNAEEPVRIIDGTAYRDV